MTRLRLLVALPVLTRLPVLRLPVLTRLVEPLELVPPLLTLLLVPPLAFEPSR